MRALKLAKNQIVEGVIWEQLLLFFFPLMLGTFFQVLYNTVDAAVVGRFVSKVALAAVGGPTGVLIALVISFFIGITTGATVVIAQSWGAEDMERTSLALHTSVALGLAGGAVIGLLGMFLSKGALALMNTPPSVLPYAETYLKIFMGGSGFGLIYNVGAAILRARGDSKRPFYLLVAGTLLNILLDLLFVARLGWGVAGAGWATVLSQGVSAWGVWILLTREEAPFRLEWRKIRFTLPLLRTIVNIGLPAALQSSMYAVANIVIQASVNAFGVNVVAAWTVLSKSDALYWQMMGAFGMALSTFSGQNFGARKYDRVIQSISSCTLMAFIATVFTSAVMMIFAEEIYFFFTDDREVVNIAMSMMKTMVPYYFTYVFIETLGGGIRGTGDSLVPTIMMAVGICVFRLCWVWFVLPLHRTILILCWSYPISWVITSFSFILYYRRSHWMERSIVRSGHVPSPKQDAAP